MFNSIKAWFVGLSILSLLILCVTVVITVEHENIMKNYLITNRGAAINRTFDISETMDWIESIEEKTISSVDWGGDGYSWKGAPELRIIGFTNLWDNSTRYASAPNLSYTRGGTSIQQTNITSTWNTNLVSRGNSDKKSNPLLLNGNQYKMNTVRRVHVSDGSYFYMHSNHRSVALREISILDSLRNENDLKGGSSRNITYDEFFNLTSQRITFPVRKWDYSNNRMIETTSSIYVNANIADIVEEMLTVIYEKHPYFSINDIAFYSKREGANSWFGSIGHNQGIAFDLNYAHNSWLVTDENGLITNWKTGGSNVATSSSPMAVGVKKYWYSLNGNLTLDELKSILDNPSLVTELMCPNVIPNSVRETILNFGWHSAVWNRGTSWDMMHFSIDGV